jgi:hypothetical protein
MSAIKKIFGFGKNKSPKSDQPNGDNTPTTSARTNSSSPSVETPSSDSKDVDQEESMYNNAVARLAKKTGNVDDYSDIIQEDDDTSRAAAHTATEKEIDSEIQRLLGPIKEWSRDDEEVSCFRVAMKTCKSMTQNTSFERKDLLPPVYLTSDPPLMTNKGDDGFFCRVNLVGTTSMQKTIKCRYDQSADDFADEFALRIAKSHNMNRDKENWVFKATGTAEYLYGSHKLVDFEYIRNCLKKGQQVHLNLMDKDLVLQELDPHDQALKTVSYDFTYQGPQGPHLEETMKTYEDLQFNKYAEDTWRPNRKALCIQDITRPFRVKIRGIDNLIPSATTVDKLKADVSEFSVYVVVEFFVGSVQLTKSRHTKLNIYQRDIRWDEFIYTDMLYAELPRDTKMCVSVFARLYKPNDPHLNNNDRNLVQDIDGVISFEMSQSSGRESIRISSPDTDEPLDMFSTKTRAEVVATFKDIPLGYASIPLFDFKGHLRSGIVKWPLWPDDCSSPIQPSLPNLPVGSEGYPGAFPAWLIFSLDTFALPVVYPKNQNSIPPAMLADRFAAWEEQKRKQYTVGESQVEQLTVQREINKIIQYDPLRELSDQDRWRIWDNRHSLKTNPKALTKFFMSVPYQYPSAVYEAHQLLLQWAPPAAIDALEFLNYNFGNSRLREYALERLNNMGDNELADFLLQLTQALKYEPYHDTALSRFLLQRGLRSTHLIGHILFWSLKAEMDSFGIIRERHGLILEEYLKNCGGHRRELMKQNGVVQQLLDIAMLIKRTEKEERVNVLHDQLRKLKKPPKFKLPLSPRMEVNGLIVEKCKVMSSKKLPLWLVFTNADPTGAPIYIIFKAGDDLRQDLLTLQLLRVMDKLWKSIGRLDLHMQPYGCVCTGDMVGMIEVVLNSCTVAQIQAGKGGVQAALTSDTPLVDWLFENNKKEDHAQCVSNFVLSCAGYCTATFVLGIGDRHNDNIMLTKNGDLFHIDFGHFLGHYKKKLGIQRETTPFVFTTMYARVMGGVDTEEFNRWKKLSKEAFQLLRQNGHLIMNLFVLMLATGIPELTTTKEIEWLRERLVFEMTEEESDKFFDKQIKDSLGNFRARLMDGAHLAIHYK